MSALKIAIAAALLARIAITLICPAKYVTVKAAF